MEDKIKEQVEQIHEGIQNLKGRTNFNVLRHRDRLWEIESGVDRYRSDQQQLDALRHVLSIFQETAGLTTEGVATYDQTIWDANIQAHGKMVTLEQLFDELQKLVVKYYKI